MSHVVNCRQLEKHFRVYEKQPGFLGTVESFFRRRYSVKSAVSSFDFQVKPGEMLGLLGPNGAGKTTLIKMLSGIIVPSAGEISVLGHQPFAREMAFRKKVALVMGQKSQLWWDIPAIDSFRLLQAYYEINSQDFTRKLDYLAELLGVSSLLKVQIRKLSLGERMKMELIACLLHEPQVVFLDEPTIGLDLTSQVKIRQFLKDYQRQHQTTIILTSHYMADVMALCSRIVLVLAGRKCFDGPIEQFSKILGSEKFVTIDFAEAMDDSLNLWHSLDAKWNESKTHVELRIPEASLRSTMVEILQKFPVTDVASEKMPIERVLHTLMASPDLLAKGDL